MSSDQQTQDFSGATAMGAGPDASSSSSSSSAASSSSPAEERPEVLVGAAFAGGFVAAMILKRLVG